ncbi:collagen alpha-1(I) chain-like [Erinaceus europaeus]|uniref:Collagen alpha-1(I) chain-like n=1 Tax=Erinaceus europaeus TaxID=9365 RepID=A0ABM3VRI3_ERIEU|nr:collagen alpha-1(I) chain-like [Erinaceus europaeus]
MPREEPESPEAAPITSGVASVTSFSGARAVRLGAAARGTRDPEHPDRVWAEGGRVSRAAVGPAGGAAAAPAPHEPGPARGARSGCSGLCGLPGHVRGLVPGGVELLEETQRLLSRYVMPDSFALVASLGSWRGAGRTPPSPSRRPAVQPRGGRAFHGTAGPPAHLGGRPSASREERSGLPAASRSRAPQAWAAPGRPARTDASRLRSGSGSSTAGWAGEAETEAPPTPQARRDGTDGWAARQKPVRAASPPAAEATAAKTRSAAPGRRRTRCGQRAGPSATVAAPSCTGGSRARGIVSAAMPPAGGASAGALQSLAA